jgi:hypothetical protein
MYEIVRNLPVAKFYYKGSHSHPVRRTVLLIECKQNYIRGYELREGRVVREYKNAPIKTYRRSRIAKESDLGARKHRIPGPKVTTLRRKKLLDLFETGV